MEIGVFDVRVHPTDPFLDGWWAFDFAAEVVQGFLLFNLAAAAVVAELGAVETATNFCAGLNGWEAQRLEVLQRNASFDFISAFGRVAFCFQTVKAPFGVEITIK